MWSDGLWNVKPRAADVAAQAVLARRSGRSFTPTGERMNSVSGHLFLVVAG
jgi:fructose-1,6-bisphosphatase/inositol monophosphatase family enzyme